MAGTFYARESVSVLYNFVREALREDWLPFELLGPGGLKLTDENLAFNECGLVSEKKNFGAFQNILRLSEPCAAQSWGRFVSFQSPGCALSPHFKPKQSGTEGQRDCGTEGGVPVPGRGGAGQALGFLASPPRLAVVSDNPCCGQWRFQLWSVTIPAVVSGISSCGQ